MRESMVTRLQFPLLIAIFAGGCTTANPNYQQSVLPDDAEDLGCGTTGCTSHNLGDLAGSVPDLAAMSEPMDLSANVPDLSILPGLPDLAVAFDLKNSVACPANLPGANVSCSGSFECDYGTESCCGVTFTSVRCFCSGGKFECLSTDHCLAPTCPDMAVPPPVICGLLSCSISQQCMDDPHDGCDPTQGGADCPGVCVSCGPTGSCIQGPSCGNTCCGTGEWCDTSFSSSPTCRCGKDNACSGGDHCAQGLIGSVTNTCGTMCCGQNHPCPL